MSILIVRKHSRFAVRYPARLKNGDTLHAKALLIELSLQGCRLSGIADEAFRPGDMATLHIDGCEDLRGEISWTREGMVGLRFARVLQFVELDRLVRVCRDEPDIIPTPARAPVLRVVAS